MCLKMKSEGAEGEGIVIGYDRRFLSKEAVIWASQMFTGDQGVVCEPERANTTDYVLCHEAWAELRNDGDSKPQSSHL